MLNIQSISETLAALGSAALIAGCGGAAQDTVSASEVSAEPTAKATEAPTEKTAGDAAAAATDAAAATTAAPDAKAPDGATATAPPAPRAGGSPIPTVDEWNAEKKEVTVKGSSPLGCETKMVREYLRISCRGKNDTGGTPVSVVAQKGGQDAYFFANGGVVSAVLPYVSGVDTTLAFTWTDKTHAVQVTWPKGAPKPPQLGVFAEAQKPATAATATPAKTGTATAKPAPAAAGKKKEGKKAGAEGECGEGTCA